MGATVEEEAVNTKKKKKSTRAHEQKEQTLAHEQENVIDARQADR